VSTNVPVGADVSTESDVYQEIEKILKKIKQLESGMYSEDNKPAITKFYKFCKSHS